jgi:hypothetical protein
LICKTLKDEGLVCYFDPLITRHRRKGTAYGSLGLALLLTNP